MIFFFKFHPNEPIQTYREMSSNLAGALKKKQETHPETTTTDLILTG